MKNKDSFSKTKLWKILTGLFLAVFLLALPLNLSGQSTVFYDDFNRASLSPGGIPSVTYTQVLGTGSAITTVTSLDIKAAVSAAGSSYVAATYPTSSIFSTTLSSNTGLVSWSFNLRESKGTGNLGGFVAGKYGVAVVLAASEANPLSATCNGYAVVCNGTAAPYVYNLVRFTGGLSANTNVTNLVAGTLPGSTAPNLMSDYMSIMVSYDHSSDTWRLYERDDAATAFSDPTTLNVSNLMGSTTDATYTTTPLINFGLMWNYGSAGTQYKATLDNFKLTVNVPVSWTSGWPKAEVPTPTGFTAKVNLNVAGTVYYVVVPSGTSAPTSADVKAGTATGKIVSGSIPCALEATEYLSAVVGLAASTLYNVYYVAEDVLGNNLQASPILKSITTTDAATAPTISTPTATSITNNSAVLGANITSDGGATIIERGTVWSTSTGVGIGDNILDETGRTAGIFSHNRTALPAKTQIFYKAYAINSVNTVLSSEASFYTLANEPTTQVTGLTATVAGSSSIDLSWTPATDADGYIILIRQSATPPTTSPADLNIYTIGSVIGNGTVAAYITSGSVTSSNIAGLNPGSVYSFKVFSVNSDGINAATYNYFTTSAPTVSLTLTATYTLNQTGDNISISTRNRQIVVNGTDVNGAKIEVFNTIGQKVITRNVTGATVQESYNLLSGTYLVRVTIEGKIITKKIIID